MQTPERRRQYRLETVEHRRQYAREYGQRNRTRLSALKREWVRRNPEKNKASCRKYAASEKGKAQRRKNWEKHLAGQRMWRKSPKGFLSCKNTRLKRYFGITLDGYNAMLERQGGVCAICKERDPNTSLAVDHCEVTGKIRGLLCFKCNSAIGSFGHSTDRLGSAIIYLMNAALIP